MYFKGTKPFLACLCVACEEAENRDLEERLEEARSAAAVAGSELATAQVANEGFKTQITQLKVRRGAVAHVWVPFFISSVYFLFFLCVCIFLYLWCFDL